MGLYLCVFEDDRSDNELEGVEVGGYDDFDALRQTVARLEPQGWGSRFPVLMMHPDNDGEWPLEDLPRLRDELRRILDDLSRQAPPPYEPGWQHELARRVGHRPSSMAEFFIDVDGEPLLERLAAMVEFAIDRRRPVTFA